MAKKTWDRVKEGLDKALEAARKAAKIVGDKAGETAQITKLSVEAMTLEHQMSKKYAELGNLAYQWMAKGKKGSLASQVKVKKIVEETKKLEEQLNKNHRAMQAEKKRK